MRDESRPMVVRQERSYDRVKRNDARIVNQDRVKRRMYDCMYEKIKQNLGCELKLLTSSLRNLAVQRPGILFEKRKVVQLCVRCDAKKGSQLCNVMAKMMQCSHFVHLHTSAESKQAHTASGGSLLPHQASCSPSPHARQRGLDHAKDLLSYTFHQVFWTRSVTRTERPPFFPQLTLHHHIALCTSNNILEYLKFGKKNAVRIFFQRPDKDPGCLSYKLYRLFLSPHSLSVTTVTLGFRLFFILLQINLLRIQDRPRAQVQCGRRWARTCRRWCRGGCLRRSTCTRRRAKICSVCRAGRQACGITMRHVCTSWSRRTGSTRGSLRGALCRRRCGCSLG